MKSKIIIIGSGLAGITIANELIKHCDVTVIEKGPSEGVVLPKKRFLSKNFGVGPTYCNPVGGTTNLWHNGLIDLVVDDVTTPFSKVLLKSRKYIDAAANKLFFKGTYTVEKERRNSYYREVVKKF
jgi:predicted NAD/FAD-dependent oxidoreductase